MKLKLFMPTTSIAGGLFMLKRTIKKSDPAGSDFLCVELIIYFLISL